MIPDEVTTLPRYPHLDEIAGTLATRNLLMLNAEPGAGKTTLVPWRLLAHKAFAGTKFLLLQPRRIAARAAAERIAALREERLGQTVGLRTRMETIVSPMTRLEVVTEGVLTRIIQNDPSLSGYGLVIFDEFHERNLCGQPLMLHLLSPAGRPVQITQDLDGFWERSYPAVKKELMGRYPRHYWPDDPRAAKPTAQAKKKRR